MTTRPGAPALPSAAPSAPAAPGALPERPPLRRPPHGRMLAGVCRGVSVHLGIPVVPLRIATFVGVVVFGAGVVVYGFLWLTMPVGDQGVAEEDAALIDRRSLSTRWVVLGGVLLALAGISTLVIGSTINPSAVLPLLAIVAGLLLSWSLLDGRRRQHWLAGTDLARGESLLRVGLGAALVLGGIAVLISGGRGLGGLRDVLLATLVVLVGVTLLVAPFAIRLFEDFRREQTERIRVTEKADIAAHLHDSVLQTLALIQRRADDPAAVQRLARGQERELRQWLFADAAPAGATLATAVRSTTDEIEDQLGVPVDLVVTGDRPLDEHGAALVAAVREAVSNAVRHAAPPVSAYVEVGPGETEAFVRDHGAGFDPDAVPADRLGVRESIVGRMERHGGSAEVRRREDGTEVVLRLPHLSGEERAAQGGGEERDAGRSGVRPSATEGMSGEERAAQGGGEERAAVQGGEEESG
ncbi:PspC domain-containing protein [Barrientosiimonas humi]|uniref:PspC domain-containing protein n=1 Tax=Barrientosiimonas humi TaxID=999931 RepID=UPI00370DC0A6